MKLKIEIKHWATGAVLFEFEKENNSIKETLIEAVKRGADLRGANLYGANLYGADLRGADLRGANLYGADLKNLPEDFINQCSRDILFVLEHLKPEVPFLREKLIAGEVDGSTYMGECACLLGTLANGNGGLDKVCASIPFYEKGTHNPGESFFLNIKKGDTPKNNEFAKHALMLIDMVLGKPAKKKKAA